MTANQRLKSFIDSEKISQIEFSQQTGIEKSKVSNFLKWPKKGGTEFPRIDFFQLIAKAYPRLNMRWLLIGEGKMKLSDDEQREMAIDENEYLLEIGQLRMTDRKKNKRIDALEKLTEEQQAVIEKFGEFLESQFEKEELEKLREEFEIEWKKNS